MKQPRICVTITNRNWKAAREVESEVDLFEVRLDLVGPDWRQMVKAIKKPWIACNRRPEEGGKGSLDEKKRVGELLRAIEAGASIIDIELETKILAEIVPLIKSQAKCLISFHDMVKTPAIKTLTGIINRQQKAGADICKVVTTARRLEDNLIVLKTVEQFAYTKVVAFAMGKDGQISRFLAPIAGAYFTYASISQGKESANGQLPVREMRELYRYLGRS
jgi:3-dehydroquinate dehydratase-1